MPPASFDWARLIANKDREIDRLEGVYRKLLDGAGVEMHDGRARLPTPHGRGRGKRFTAETVLIATGGHPFIPPGQAGSTPSPPTRPFTWPSCRAAWRSTAAATSRSSSPGSSTAWARDVTQIYRGPRVLRGFDEDVRATVDAEMAKKGIAFKYNTVIDRVDQARRRALDVALMTVLPWRSTA